MSREIKYQAWVKDLKEMVEVDELRYFPNEVNQLELKNIWFTCHNSLTRSMRLIEKVELREFTGLHDKNGTEIYEGDIVKSLRYENAVIKYRDSAFYACSSLRCFSLNALGSHDPENLEVIGNRFENPELLEG